jgi:hypothetical protein
MLLMPAVALIPRVTTNVASQKTTRITTPM